VSMYSRKDIDDTLDALNKGRVILYPTDTIWGLGCDAGNHKAIERIYKIKQRSDSKSMLVLLDNENMLRQYVKEVPDIAWELIEVSDKPLTIIYPGAKNIARNLVAEDGSIGIRIVKDAFCSELIRRFRKPLVSTSANISGSPPPANFDMIEDEIKEAADHIVLYRQDDLQPSSASSIIKLAPNGEFTIVRK